MSSKWLKNVKKANNEKCPLGVRGRRESPTPQKIYTTARRVGMGIVHTLEHVGGR